MCYSRMLRLLADNLFDVIAVRKIGIEVGNRLLVRPRVAEPVSYSGVHVKLFGIGIHY
jgi:hypothetical protein